MKGKLKLDAIANARDLLRQLDRFDYFVPNKDGETPIHITVEYGDSPLVIVVGENASGKSFLRRVLCGMIHDCGHEVMHLSMEGRFNYNHNPLRSMIYGDEKTRATGVNSVKLITAGLHNCESRADKPHAIIWDEPELGLSEGAQMGVGATLAEGVRKLPKKTLAAVVITHSRPIVRQIAHLGPHFIFVGDDPLSLYDWLTATPKIRMPEEIEAEGRRRFKLINAILNKKREGENR